MHLLSGPVASASGDGIRPFTSTDRRLHEWALKEEIHQASQEWQPLINQDEPIGGDGCVYDQRRLAGSVEKQTLAIDDGQHGGDLEGPLLIDVRCWGRAFGMRIMRPTTQVRFAADPDWARLGWHGAGGDGRYVRLGGSNPTETMVN